MLQLIRKNIIKIQNTISIIELNFAIADHTVDSTVLVCDVFEIIFDDIFDCVTNFLPYSFI